MKATQALRVWAVLKQAGFDATIEPGNVVAVGLTNRAVSRHEVEVALNYALPRSQLVSDGPAVKILV